MDHETTIFPNERFQPREGVTCREFDGDWVLLDLGAGKYFGLDAIGGVVWTNLIAGRTLGEIAGVLSTTYDVNSEQALRDTFALVGEMVGCGLVTRAP